MHGSRSALHRVNHGRATSIIGSHACILHGHVRTTEVVGTLVKDSLENFQRLIAGVSAFGNHAAADITPQGIAEIGS